MKNEPKHVVSLSGGKDSTALALVLMEREPRNYEFICNMTGNELPEMADHMCKLERRLGQPFRQVGAGMDLFDLIAKSKMLPNFRARFCTRVLKIEPTIDYMQSLPEGSVLYVGLRADEEMRQGIFGEDLNIRYPFREWGWGIKEVWAFLDERGVQIPNRTDCGVCFYQRLGEWWNLWKHHPGEFAKGVFVEDLYDHTFRSPSRDSWPASLAELAREFEQGRVPRGADLEYRPFAGGADACRVCRL